MTDEGCSPLCFFVYSCLMVGVGKMRFAEKILELPSSYVMLPSMMGLR